MKRIIVSFFCFFIFLATIMPFFPYVKSTEIKKAGAVTVYSEREIDFVCDIVGTEKSFFYDDINNISLKEDAILNQNPFDVVSKTMMPGYSIVPDFDSKNYEVKNKTYNFSSFQIVDDGTNSIFMWIYIPDDPAKNLYALTISFMGTRGEQLTWKFDDFMLADMLPRQYSDRYGWRLFEFSLQDADIRGSFNSSSYFSTMTIDYQLDSKYVIEGITSGIGENGPLSFYHIFVGKSKNEKSSIVFQSEYFYYKINSEFSNMINSLYLGDSFRFTGLSQIFDYIYVARYNMLLSGVQNNAFQWVFTMRNSNRTSEIFENNIIDCSTYGWNYFLISLSEQRGKKLVSVFNNISVSFYIEDYKFGKFSTTNYYLEDKNVHTIVFRISKDFIYNKDIQFISSDVNSLEIIKFEYNDANDCYYINIVAKKSGIANIVASANGQRVGKTLGVYECSSSVNIEVRDPFLSHNMWIFVIVTIGGGITIFLFITMINYNRAKKIDKQRL